MNHSISEVAYLHRGSAWNAENLLGKLALCAYESCVKSIPRGEVAAQRFPNSQAAETLIKAAQDPAMSNVPGYAQELTRMAYGELMDLLRAAAILPQCVPAARSHAFDGASSIYVPKRVGGSAAGAFRAEGSAITVRGLLFSHVLLKPKNVSVILTATAEMLSRSSIDLASYFESEIAKDTGEALDQIFVGDGPATAISPAGARAGLTAADTRASSGATAADIVADIKAMTKALSDAKMGAPATTKWLMNPSNLVALSVLLTASGSKQFPEAESGRLATYPVVTSTTMPSDIVLLIDFSQFTFALGNPAFEATTVAELHEEDTTPLPIATPGAPATVAAPARSLFQTNSWALRLVTTVDWLKLRESCVQELTAVAW